MAHLLGITDYVIIVLMLCVSAVIGIYFRFTGGRQKVADEFLMGNREMSVTPVAISLMGTCLSSVFVLGVPAETYLYGTQLAVTILGIPIGGLVAVYGFLPVFYDMKVSTAYEYLEKRFGKTTRTVSAVLFTVSMILYMGIVLYTPSLALNAVTGLSTWTSVLTLAVVCAFYSALGGLKAVLWTVVFQAVLMYISVTAVIVKIVMILGFKDANGVAYQESRVNLFNFSWSLTERYTFWNSLFAGIVFYTNTFAVNQSQIQRFLSVGSTRKAQKVLFVSLPLILLFKFFTYWDGVVIYSFFHNCDPMMDKGVKLGSSDQLFPYTVLKIFGDIPGLSGLCIAGVFGSSLGTLSSAVNTLAAVTVEDFIKPYCFCKKLSDVWMSFIAKVVALLFVALTLLMVLIAANFRGVIEATSIVMGMVGGTVLAVYSLGMFSTTANEPGTLIGLLVGFTVYAWMSIGSYLTKADFKTLSRSTERCPANSSLEFLNATQGSLVLNIAKPLFIPREEEKYIFPVYRWSFMWFPVFAFVIVLLVGYTASLIISFWFNAPKVKPESLSPIVRKLYFKPAKSVDETKGVCSEMELSDREKNENTPYLVSYGHVNPAMTETEYM